MEQNKKSKISKIANWMDALKNGLTLWSEFTLHGRVKTLDKVKEIEQLHLINVEEEIKSIKDNVALITTKDRFSFAADLTELEQDKNLKQLIENEWNYLSTVIRNSSFFDSQRRAYFFGYDDNDKEVNDLNLKLLDLFTTMDIALTNVNGLIDDMQKSTKHDELVLPVELDTEQFRKYLAKAINVRYVRKEGSGYKWIFGGNKGQSRLGYFCNKAFTPPRPINKLEQIFGVKKLSASISNAEIEAKRADVKRWRNEMKNNIFND